MKRIFLILFFVFSFILNSSAKSIVQEGPAYITFHKIYIPETVKQGELFQISAELSTNKNIWEDMQVFLHIVSPTDNKILINNDFSPSIPTTHWTPGEIVRLGPVNAYIPKNFPPGTYNIQMGLYTSKITPQEVLHIRQPYTNPEIKDFIVAKIKVEEAKLKETPKKEDLILSNFETLVDIKKWQMRSCLIEQDKENKVEGNFCAKITYLKNKGCCPSAILESFFRYSDPKYSNWSDYDILQFYIYGPKDEEGKTYLKYPVVLQVKDKSERRFQFPIPSNQQKDQPFSINLSVIGKVVDLTDIGNLSFFVAGTPPEEDWVIFLDDIRLISLNIEREPDPFVKFEGLKLSKDKVKPNEEIEIEASFSITKRFADEYGIFIHIYRALDKAGWINADATPSPPTTEWEVNKVIKQGPFKIYIPPDAPLGRYNIEMGLFLAKQIPQGTKYVKIHRGKDGVYYIQQPSYPVDYFKQPYINYQEYGDWVVGSFEVVSP